MKTILIIIVLLFINTSLFAQIEPRDIDDNGYRNISLLEHLRWVSENSFCWEDNFELDNNILAGETKLWNSGKGFSPIGNRSIPFTGKFEGRGFIIDSLYINRPKEDYIAFFGVVNGETSLIQDVGLVNCDIHGDFYVAALVAEGINSNIRGSYSTGDVSGSNNIGGLVAYFSNGRIWNSYSEANVFGEKYTGGLTAFIVGSTVLNSYFIGNVSGKLYAGGLIANCTSSTLSYCYNTGKVSGTEYIGGLIGLNENSTVTISYSSGNIKGKKYVGGFTGVNHYSNITDSYAQGSVIGEEFVGGFAGVNDNSSILNTYSIGNVLGKENIGGLIGKNAEGSVKSSFWDIQTSKQEKSDGGDGKNTISMNSKTMFVNRNWNFDNIWKIDSTINNAYPYIYISMVPHTIGIEPNDINKNGYRNISKFAHLVWVSENDNSWSWNFELDNDINASDSRRWNGGFGFSPIGNFINKFTGKFNGRGYKIDSLYIHYPELKYAGFFGMISGENCEINNISIENCDVVGDTYVGALVGYCDSVSITLSNSTGKVKGINCGGLIGKNFNSLLFELSSSCTVFGKNSTGGIIGENSGIVTKSNSSANCYGAYSVGGLIGINIGDVSNSTANGEIEGDSNVGGLIGSNSGVITNSYFYGNVIGTDNIGGLVGENSASERYKDTAKVINSYSFGDVSGNNFVGGLIGKNITSLVLKSYSTGNVLGKNNISGFIGINDNSIIRSSYSTGNSTGDSIVGGFIGKNNNLSVVLNSYSLGNVNGNSDIGGFIANNSNAIISDSYSIGKTSGSKRVGGLVGVNLGFVSNSFWNIETSEIDSSAGGIGKTTLQMTTKITYDNANWNLIGIWAIDSMINNSYPSFATGELLVPVTIGIEPKDIDNNGYRNISIFAHLVWVSENDSSWTWNFELDNDIDAIQTIYWETLKGFSPIGKYRANFRGIFDGRGYKISNLYINRFRQDNIGLFGIINDDSCEIKNIEIDNCNIKGLQSVGGIVGTNMRGFILNCFSQGNIEGIKFVGGIVGDNNSIIQNCISKVAVGGNSFIGGLVGSNNKNINNSNSNSTVIGNESIGGLVGLCSGGEIVGSYSIGSVLGVSNVGGLVGSNTNGIVSNSYSKTDIKGVSYIGGLIGQNTSGKISNSYFAGDVVAVDTVGGLIGKNNTGIVIFSSSSGKIYANNTVGGLIGYNNLSIITNSYSSINIDIESNIAGGLIGLNKNSKIYNTYSYGKVIGYDYIGGLIGIDSGIVKNSFWDIQSSGLNSSAAGTGKTTNEMTSKELYQNAKWNFSHIWTKVISKNHSYPIFVSNKIYIPKPIGIKPIDIDKNGFKNIESFDNLVWISQNSDSWSWNFELSNDIYAEKTMYWEDFQGFSPIGYNTTPFSGKFDGKGYKIYDLFINGNNNIGLFGYILGDGCEIKNLGLESCFLIGESYIGALVGINSASILNSNMSGIINGYDYLGGLVGNNKNGKISNSFAIGIVTGYSYIGGLIGYNDIGEVLNSSSSSDVVGGTNIGGFLGCNRLGTIANCYSIGSTNGYRNTGGLIGYATGGNISNSYSSGNVIGNNSTGGLIGFVSASTISLSFSSAIVQGEIRIGGFIGNNMRGNISNSYSTGKVKSNVGNISSQIGGFLGYNYGGRISTSYSTGEVLGTDKIGGFIGVNYAYQSIFNCFWDKQTSKQKYSNGGTPKTTVDMTTKSTFTSVEWDFETIWGMHPQKNNGYPYLLSSPVNVQEINSLQEKINLELFPNPINKGNVLNININKSIIDYTIKIYSFGGFLIAEYKNQKQIQITNFYTPSTYFLVIESGGKIIAKSKFIVE